MLFFFSACARSAPAYPTANPNASLIGTIVAQTLTAFPSATTQTAALPAQRPQDFISGYFDAINSRNYTLTWSLLSDRFKDALNGPSQGGYQVYVEFWDSVNRVTVLEVTHTCQGEMCAVNVTLQLDYKNGQFDTSIYPYTLTYDRARSTWLFDLLPPEPAAQANPTATPLGMVTPPLHLCQNARITSPATWWIMQPGAAIRSRRWQPISTQPAQQSAAAIRKSPWMSPPCRPE